MGQRSSDSSETSFSDPDQAQAWEELNEFMDSPGASGSSSTGRQATGKGQSTSRSRDSGFRNRGTSSGRTKGGGRIPESLRKDFANLEVPFGAGLEQARAAHRRLIRAYHPDRHATNPDKYRIANQITQRVNYSYQRIKQFYEKGIRPEDQGS